jgi:hypothetical protein
MKLDKNIISYIQTVVETSRLIGIDSVIIEPNFVRAWDDAKTVVLFQDKDVPDMPFGSIGLNRLNIFTARYDIAKIQDNFTIEAEVDDGNSFARSLIMKAKGMKIDYRAANPLAIKAPKQIHDAAKYRIQLTPEAVLYLQKAQSAFKEAERVSFISDGKQVSLELCDVNNDVFKYIFAENVECLTGGDGKFAFRYSIKSLLPLLKHNSQGHFTIGAKGIMVFPLNNLTVHVLPQE